LEQTNDLLDILHSALEKPAFDSGYDYHKGFADFQLPLLTQYKQSSQLLALAARVEMRRGNLEGTATHITTLLKLVASQKDERLIISQLVRHAYANEAFGVLWEAMQLPGWTEPQLKQFQDAWGQNHFDQDMATALEMERAMTLDYFRILKSSASARSKAVANAKQSEELMGEGYIRHRNWFIYEHFHMPLWSIAWADQDARLGLDRWTAIIDAERQTRSKSWLKGKPALDAADDWISQMAGVTFGDAPPDLSWYDRYRYAISGNTFSIRGLIVFKTLKIETQKNLALTAIALKRYHLRYGKIPASLPDLKAEFLPELPPDCMIGEPLRYLPNTDGTYLLYSVGTDGKDDGGDAKPTSGKKERYDMWDAPDVVWPWPATPDQISEFEASQSKS
jgi:hypothetical protein